MKIRNTLTIAVTAALLASSASLFAASYNVTDLGANSASWHLYSIQINSKGQILVVANRVNTFLYANGVKKELTANLKLPHPDNVFKGFNDNGQAVGFSAKSSSNANGLAIVEQRKGFVWANGIAKVLSVPSSAGRLAASYTADFINNKGQILGTSDYIIDDTTPIRPRTPSKVLIRGHHVMLWNKNGTVSTDLTPNLDDSTETAYPIDINNNGQVIFSIIKYTSDKWDDITNISSFIWENGTLTPLKSVGIPSSKTYSDTTAHDINDRGQVVGSSNGKAILWDDHDDGQAIVLTPLKKPNANFSDATHINNQGEIIGSAWGGDGPNAVIWNDWDDSVIDLGEYVTLTGINNKGQVVGFNGKYIPFVWERGGSKVSLPTLPSTVLSLDDHQPVINDKGQIAGANYGSDTSLIHVASWKLGK